MLKYDTIHVEYCGHQWHLLTFYPLICRAKVMLQAAESEEDKTRRPRARNMLEAFQQIGAP